MAVALEQFAQQLEDSGLLSAETLRDFIPPKAAPKDAEELACELIRRRKLTRFQAEEVYRGRGKSLVLGNYVLREKIGAGGMGVVFQAEHRRMQRIVAVKLLPEAMLQNSAAIARFEREVKAIAKISHPNLVAAYDADHAHGVHFLVMEYVEGLDLAALVKKQGPLRVGQAVEYLLQAAHGLNAAHASGVVHRDIKPGNLVLDKKGVVKVLDLGLASLKADSDTRDQADLTSSSMMMGTIGYMAPEQAVNTKRADPRADVYSLGCTLFYLLTGMPIYAGDSPMAKLIAHREQPIPSLRAVRRDVPEHLDAVFRTMSPKKADDRYRSMSEVITHLQQCVVSQSPSLSTPLALSATDWAVTRGFHDVVPRPPEPARREKGDAPVLRKRGRAGLLLGVGLLGLLILLAGVVVALRTRDGTLFVTVDEPDVRIEVLDAEGKVEITRRGGQGVNAISVAPGKHDLRVEKDGFILFTEEFEVEASGKRVIAAKLVPREEKPARREAEPAKSEDNRAVAIEPQDGPWTEQVAKMPAKEQVKAVAKKLIERNPGFDGIVTPRIEGGVVTELRFLTDQVTDISPVRALTQLRTLNCGGSWTPRNGMGRITDLSPLKGMKLSKLIIDNTQLADLSPLAEVPLTHLACPWTQVTDLSPLAGLPLTELDLQHTRVWDLSPLQGMRLTKLLCRGAQVHDLSPLEKMPLAFLELGYAPVADLSPIQGMPLQHLRIYHTRVSDLSPVTGMKLASLWLNNTQVSDLSPIEGMNLETITLTPKNITQGMELVRQMKSLQTIGLAGVVFPPEEFWRKYDAGEFGKPPPP